MAKHFKVDTGHLERFVKSLQESVKELEEARKALAHVRSDQIGTVRLDAACDTFQERWKHGSEQLGQMLAVIVEGVKENKKSYEELEKNLEKALKEMGESASSAGGGR